MNRKRAWKIAVSNYRGRYFDVPELQMQIYQIAYPRTDLMAEFRMMEIWLESNPRRRKKNYSRFIANWLNAEHRKTGTRHQDVTIGMGPSDQYSNIRLKPEAWARIQERERKREEERKRQ